MYDKQNKHSINNLFQNISNRYDLINDIMSFGLHKKIKEKAVKNINLKNPSLILDLCTGTGDLLLILKKEYPDATIIGLDFSKNMLQIAEEKIKSEKNIILKEMDVTILDLEKNSFDICFISFGLRNLPDIKKTLNDIKDILKPSGTISILDLGKPNALINPLFKIYFNKIIPIIGKIFNKDKNPYEYLTESVKTYPSQDKIISMLEEVGFVYCQKTDYVFGIISQQTGTKK